LNKVEERMALGTTQDFIFRLCSQRIQREAILERTVPGFSGMVSMCAEEETDERACRESIAETEEVFLDVRRKGWAEDLLTTEAGEGAREDVGDSGGVPLSHCWLVVVSRRWRRGVGAWMCGVWPDGADIVGAQE
jgi:hypothetical protein